MKTPYSSGFTLLELSIVLVIIGLIVGGVLVGQDLIHTAELRALIKQQEDFATAVQTFRTKYNCLPGDCAVAVQLGLGTASGVGDNGNGNGHIGRYDDTDPPCGAGYYLSEVVNFWYHLRIANLISGDFTTPHCGFTEALNYTYVPKPKLRTVAPFVNRPAGWWILDDWLTGSFPGFSGNHALWLTGGYNIIGQDGGASMKPLDVYNIDNKIDDGLPDSGSVRGTAAFVNLPGPEPTTDTGDSEGLGLCAVNITTNRYNYADSNAYCGLLIKEPF